MTEWKSCYSPDMKTNEIFTMINAKGRTVLTKKGGDFPTQYANDTQANKKLAQLGDEWEILRPGMYARGLQIAKKVCQTINLTSP